MSLRPFSIQINRHPPFIGLFISSAAAWDALWDGAFTETTRLGGCKLIIRRCDETETFLAETAQRLAVLEAGRLRLAGGVATRPQNPVRARESDDDLLSRSGNL